MKRKLLLLSLMVMISGVIHAQDGEKIPRQQAKRLTVEERVKTQTDRMKKDFELTDAQYDSVKSINLKYETKAEELFKNSRDDFAASKEKIQKNQEDQKAELKTVLTEEQYKKYEEQLSSRKDKGVKRGQRDGSQKPKKDK
jgi:hypothetical protein